MSSGVNVVRTIRLDDSAVAEICRKIVEASAQSRDRRRSQRYPYHVKGCVIHLQPQGGGPPTSYLVPTHDISNSGLGFLHGAFIYPGAKCVIQLITLHGTWQNVPSIIARCDYVETGVHSIGARFLTPVDASEFCAEAAPSRILIVDDNPAIRRFTEAMLTTMNAEIHMAADGKAALELALAQMYDLVLLDMDMPVMNGYETVRELRKAGYSGTVVAATGMTQPDDEQKCLEAGCDRYIPKPFSRDQLAELIRSLRHEPLYSSLAHDRLMQSHIDEFVRSIPTRIRSLETLFASGDLDPLRIACRDLKGEAGTFGFEPISSAAADVENAVYAGEPAEAIGRSLTKLSRICCQARHTSRDVGPNEDSGDDADVPTDDADIETSTATATPAAPSDSAA